jgi:hypothetical protein
MSVLYLKSYSCALLKYLAKDMEGEFRKREVPLLLRCNLALLVNMEVNIIFSNYYEIKLSNII